MFNTYVQQPNAPGLRRVVLLPDDQMAPSGQIIGSPTVLELYFPTTRGSLSVVPSPSPFGKLYNSQVSLTLPRALTDIQDFLTAHQDRRYVAYIEDANGSIHRIGGGADGAEVAIGYSIDPSLNATTFTLTHSSPIAMPYGAGGLVGIHTGPGVIDGYSIEDIIASSTATVIEQLSMISASPTWAAANLAVSTIPEGYELSHSLGSTKVAAMFFDTDGTQRHDIAYEVLDDSTIKIYLPVPDDGTTPVFTGDVYIISRSGGTLGLTVPNPNIILTIANKGDGDLIEHHQGLLMIDTFQNSDDGGRQMSDFYAASVTEASFILKNDFTNAKFNGKLLCVKL